MRTATGQDSELANWVSWDAADLEGKQAQIQIVDNNTGGWGHILVDHIMFSGEKATPLSLETRSTCWSATRSSAAPPARTARSSTGPAGTSASWPGKTARIQIIDNNTGGFGHILADQFTLADTAGRVDRPSGRTGSTTAATSTPGCTFNNVPKNKRIMIAWMNNWQYGGSVPTDPWRSAMSVPRELTLQTVRGDVRAAVRAGQAAHQAAQGQAGQPVVHPAAAGHDHAAQEGRSGDTVEIHA